MAREYSAGTVYVQVLPSLDGWFRDLQKQLDKEMGKIKNELAITPTVHMGNFSEELERELNRVRPTVTPEVAADRGQAARAGAKSAGAFADAFRAGVRAATTALPDITLGADATEVDRRIAEIRAELAALSNKQVGVDITDAEALAKLRRLRRELAALDGDEVHVQARMDINQALGNLESFAQRVKEVGRRSGGAFAEGFANQVRAAIAVLPDIELRSNAKSVDYDLAAIRAELVTLADQRIGVDVTDEQALAKLDRLMERLAVLDGETVHIQARADLTRALADLQAFAQKVKEVGRRDGGAFAEGFTGQVRAAIKALPDVKLGADSSAIDKEIAKIRAELATLADKRIGIDISDAAALDKLRMLMARLAALERRAVSVQTRVDTSKALASLQSLQDQAQVTGLAADRAVSRVRQQLNTLADRRVRLGLDDDEAKAELGRLKLELDRIKASSASVHVKASVADALAKIALVGAELTKLNGQTATPKIDDGGSVLATGNRLQWLIGLCIAGAGAIGGVAAEFLTLGAGAVVGAAGVAAMSVGLKDVLATMKAQQQASDQLGQSAAQEAAQRLSAANQLANAKDSVVSATERVADAERSASDSVRSALQGQTRAEQQLESAQVSALRAQQALTDARRDASRSIEDLQNQVKDDALSQRQAVIDLKKAQDQLAAVQASPLATPEQRDQAQLAFDEAKQHLDEIGLSYRRSQVDAAAATAAGVDGSRQVVSAQDALITSQRQVRDAQAAVTESARKLDEARVLGAQQVARAQQEVIHAQRQLEQAQAAVKTQAVQQGAAQNKLAESLEKLSPQAFQLVQYLHAQTGEWGLLHRASQNFAPGLQAGLTSLEPLFGDINDNVRILSGSMGGFFATIGDGLSHAQPFFDEVSNASITLFPRFGQTVNTAAGAVGTLVSDLIPLAPTALDTADAFSGLVAELSPFIAQATGPLLDGLQGVMEHLDFLGPLLTNLAGPAADLTEVLVSGLDDAFTQLDSDGALRNFLQALIDLVKTAAPLLGSLSAVSASILTGLTPAVRTLDYLLSPLVTLVRGFAFVLNLLPAPVLGAAAAFFLLRSNADGIQRGLAKAGAAITGALTSVGNFSTKLGVGSAAAGKFTTAGQKIGTVLGKVGQNLPVIGLAFTGLSAILSLVADAEQEAQERADAMAKALIRGGTAGADAERQLNGLRIAAEGYRNTGNVSDQWRATVAESAANRIDAAYQQQIRSLSGVELAQQRVQQAQLDYENAVRDFGSNSLEASRAHDKLTDAVRNERNAQQAAADATQTHNQRLAEQQDLILGMNDANVAHQRAQLRFQQAQVGRTRAAQQHREATAAVGQAEQDYAAAVKEHGANSDEAKRAHDAITDAKIQEQESTYAITEADLDLSAAQSNVVATAGAAAEATAKAGGESDTAAAKTRGQNQALIDLLRTEGVDLPPATLSMIAHMSDSERAFFGLKVMVDKTGTTILNLPGAAGKPPVEIKFHDNVADIEMHVKLLEEKLRREQEKIIKSIFPFATMPTVDDQKRASLASVAQALQFFKGLGRAAGGPVGGTGTGDTVPALLTPGEFVFSRPAVQNMGTGTITALHAAAIHGYATGGLVTPVAPIRLATGGTVPGGGQLTGLAATFDGVTGAITPLTAALRTRLSPAFRDTLDGSAALQLASQKNWAAITQAVVDTTNAVSTQQLPALRSGLSQVDAAVTLTATTFGQQWAQIRRYAADPVRAAITGPFNALVAAWNLINTTFAVGRPLTTIPVAFAAGGAVVGGERGRDSVLAYLTPGEFVAPVEMVNQIGLSNLEAARRSVVAGGSVEGIIPGYEAGGAVTKALAYASAQVGKPYIWGGVGPAGFDCSGLVSAVTNVLLGLPPNQRRFTTADFGPGRGAGGFLPGRNSTWVIGVSDSHMSGTLAGHNIESTTKNGISGPRVDGDASGALDPQFTKGPFFLPQIGGTFIPGPTGGAPFDVGALIANTFQSTRDAIAGLIPAFRGNALAAGATAELTQMLSAITSWAQGNLVTGGAVAGSGPVWDQIRSVAARYGWGDGPQWEALSTLIDHESGGNPLAQNPHSTAFGIGQFLDSTWAGTGIPKTSNPGLQAEAMMRYVQRRYIDPVRAWSFWRVAHWYDDGGYLPPGLSLAYNGTGQYERVLTRDQDIASQAAALAGGDFTGQLVLDSGEFLGVVRGEIRQAGENTGLAVARRTR